MIPSSQAAPMQNVMSRMRSCMRAKSDGASGGRALAESCSKFARGLRRLPVERAAMSVKARCLNYTGCLLAYRGEVIELAGHAPLVCPECGKTVSVIQN